MRKEEIIREYGITEGEYDKIISKICKRAIKRMNKDLDILFSFGDYPANFTFFDILSIKYQRLDFDEMVGVGSPSLQDCIEDVLDNEIDKLSPMEQAILYSSEVGDDYGTDPQAIHYKVFDAFKKMLDEHAYLKKIQKFTDNY